VIILTNFLLAKGDTFFISLSDLWEITFSAALASLAPD